MKITVIGSSSTGKTHYAGQLYGRLRDGHGHLKLRHPPTSLQALEKILNNLADGKAAEHTQADVYEEIDFPLVNEAGAQFDLLFPDYGGEQIKSVVMLRTILDPWVKRLREADAWILFVRPQLVQRQDDMLSRPPGKSVGTDRVLSAATDRDGAVTDTSFVELIQAALAVSCHGLASRRRAPILTILLSCWDEVFKGQPYETPEKVLYKFLPMFAEFVRSNWEADQTLVYGLSSLGKELKKDTPDAEYINRGPENFGWIVEADGRENPDLTIPIADILRLKAR